MTNLKEINFGLNQYCGPAVPHHVVAVEVNRNQIYLVDNHSKQPLPAQSSARLIQKVEQVYKVTPKPEPKFLRTEIEVIKYKNTNYIIISANDKYENGEDDICRRLGQFTYKDNDELDLIIEKLSLGRSL